MAKSNIHIIEHAQPRLPQRITDWLTVIDKFMLDNGCRSEASTTNRGADGKFSYTSRKSKKSVCIIYINSDGCIISVRGNHFVHP
jgi:hypothetical protein